MRNIGMTFRKVAAIPAKADLEMQSDFKNVLESEIARAKACDKVQGAKFKMRNKITLRFRSPSGRKRWNVPGAYHAITGQLTTVCNDGDITATTVCELLRVLAKQYAGRPIVMVLDNARYQRCKTGGGLGKGVGHYLAVPAERLAEPECDGTAGEVCQKRCLSNVDYETFESFKTGINDCLRRVATEYKNELTTLMQPNFQNLEDTNYWRCEIYTQAG